jgi:uncharacterized protein with ParB-like and HNH nuclease domain
MKFYEIENQFYSANSKKEFQECFSIKLTKIKLVKEEDIPEGEEIISLKDIIRKKRDIEELKSQIPFFKDRKPTRKFSIGEEVYVGNLFGYHVSEILEDGLIIVIENEKKHFRVLLWNEVFSIKKEKDTNLFNKDSLDIDFSTMTIQSLIHYFYHFGIDMEPEYQRGLVWNDTQKTYLIDSIFNDIDIGKFVLIKLEFEENRESYEILDGKQRLSTIIDFIEDKFKINGYFFSELSKSDKRSFFNKRISIGFSDERNFDKDKVIEYFIRLNVSGTPIEKEFLDNLKKSLSHK